LIGQLGIGSIVSYIYNPTLVIHGNMSAGYNTRVQSLGIGGWMHTIILSCQCDTNDSTCSSMNAGTGSGNTSSYAGSGSTPSSISSCINDIGIYTIDVFQCIQNIRINTPQNLTKRRSDFIIITTTWQSICGKYYKYIRYSWTQIGGIPIIFNDNTIVNNSALRIPAYTVPSIETKYVLRLTVNLINSLCVIEKDITISIVSQPIVAIIKGGIFRTVAQDSRITFDGTDSYDPDVLNGIKTYNWTCFDITLGVSCTDILHASSAKPKFVMPPKIFQTNLYEISLLFSISNTNHAIKKQDITSIRIQVQNSYPPIIGISPLQNRINKEHYQQKIL